MKIKSGFLSILIFVLFLAGIGGTMAANLWFTESRKIPAVYTEGEEAGKANPADIRGSYSFGDIEQAFGVPAGELGRAFGVAGNPASFLCKELETLYAGLEYGEIGTDAVRLFVALYLGLPYEHHEGTLLPDSALDILGERAGDELREEMDQVRSGSYTGQPE